MVSTSQDSVLPDSFQPPVIAFFDLDGTLVRGQTQVLLVKFMRSIGVVGLLFLAGTALWFVGYKLGLLKPTRRARERGAVMFKGLSEAQVEVAMDRFVEEVLVPRLDAGAMEALQAHKARGELVVIVSAALEPVVKALCRRVGGDDYVGAVCEVSQGRYTGRIEGPIPHADEKTRVAAGHMSRWGAAAADCWAYGDHESDLPLLRAVGHPVAVNPHPALLAEAERAGWPILP